MTTNPPKDGRNYQHGFTLIEMAVVVVIIGILMAAGLKAASVQRDSAAYSATRTKQEAIKQALINYLRNNRRLPCPDSKTGWGNDGAVFAVGSAPDGIENRADAGANPLNTTVACDSRVGVLPWVTLGLSRDAALDGFNNFFTYHVSAPAASANDWNITASFNSGLQGDIEIKAHAADATNPLYIRDVVVVVSHGRNGAGAWTVKGSRNVVPVAATAADESENANADAIYIIRDTNNDPAANGGAYDDVLVALTPDDLLSSLTHEQSIKSYRAEINETKLVIEDIKNALIGYAITNYRLPKASSDGGCGAFNGSGTESGACYLGNVPWAVLGVPRRDPWGNEYKYAVTPALADGTTTDKLTFTGTPTTINIVDENGTLLTNPSAAPFVVYSLGSNNQNGKCFNPLANPAADTYPAIPPNCYGTNENNPKTGATAGGNEFVKAPINIPANGALARTYYDDILDFISKTSLNTKLP